MSRVVYAERERDTDYDDSPRRTYTTVKRYQVPDRDNRDSRSTFGGGDDVKEEKIIIKRTEGGGGGGGRSGRSEVDFRSSDRVSDRDRDRDRNRRDDVDVRITERVTERDRGDADRRDVSYRVSERDSDRDRYGGGSRNEIRVVEREREISRAPSPPVEERTREWRFERERDFSPARTAREERPYDLERYSKSTEYYSQPQPIIIRERAQQAAPIIITEERREPQQIVIRREREEPQYEIIERDEVRNDRQLARREEVAATNKSVVSAKPQDEDYYFERRIREVQRDPRRRREDDIRPSDSASQVSSDESYEYVRRERYIDDERDRSPHHRRHLAEGALAGAAAGAIIRQHRKSQGREQTHGVRDVVGGAALGAVGAEVISRARSMRASSRRREHHDDDDDDRSRGGRRHRSRSRSKPRSKSRARQLGGLAAVAAVGALAGYALKQVGKNKETVIIDDSHRRRSRSRRRRGSSSDIDNARAESKHRDPEHRNRRIAQAGLATAAAAGIWDRMRSKSRGGRERSKSRVRTAVPIVGAGLGGAALAGLYEKTKANKEAKRDAIIQDELHRGRRHRSRSRSRSVPPYGPNESRRPDRPEMIAYGADPIYNNGERGYSDEEAGTYRRRHGSAGSSPDTRRRSRSRGRGYAEAGLAAAGAAAVAHEMGRSRERSRQARDRRHEDYDDHYSDDYRHGGYITPPATDHYPPQATNYPNGNYFPPPPTGEGVAREGVPTAASPISDRAYNDYATYNPAAFPPATTGAAHDAHYEPVYGDQRYADPAEAAAARELQEEREMQREREERRAHAPGQDPGNVSTFVSGERAASEVQQTREDGISSQTADRDGSRTPRARSTSRVRFDLGSNTARAPDSPSSRSQDSSSTAPGQQSSRSRGRPSSTLMNDPHERAPSSASDETIELPQRFDQHGNRTAELSGGDLAARLGAMFSGSTSHHGGGARSGNLGDILHGLASEVFNRPSDRDDRSAGRSARRSR